MIQDKEMRISAYFSQHKAEDMELWEFLQKFDSRTRSHYFKLLARLGIESFQKSQLSRYVASEEIPAPPKRGRKPKVQQPVKVMQKSEVKTEIEIENKSIPEELSQPTQPQTTNDNDNEFEVNAVNDDDDEFDINPIDKNAQLAEILANLDSF